MATTAEIRLMAEIMTECRACDWKGFVADYVTARTSRKANRELCSGYQVKRRRDWYEVWMGKTRLPYMAMNADTLYRVMQRMPLKYFADQADSARILLLQGDGSENRESWL